jgi:hypothetical protein
MANDTEQNTGQTSEAVKPTRQSAQTAQTAQADTAPGPVDELVLDVEGWAERARAAFKTSPHALRGALFGQEAETWTEDEVRKLIDEFSVREGI